MEPLRAAGGEGQEVPGAPGRAAGAGDLGLAGAAGRAPGERPSRCPTDYEHGRPPAGGGPSGRWRRAVRPAEEQLYRADAGEGVGGRAGPVCQLGSREASAHECESAVAVLKNGIQNNLENADRIRAELEASRRAGPGSLSGQIAERAGPAERDRRKRWRTAAGRAGSRREGRPAGQPARRAPCSPELEALREQEAAGDRLRRRGQEPCSPPWPPPPRSCWTGTRRCARS